MSDIDDDAIMLGLSPAEFNRQIGATTGDPADRHWSASDDDQTPPSAHRLVVLSQPWGWAELLVRAPFDYRIEAIGVVPPGLAVHPDMVEAHRATSWNSRGLPLSAAGVGAGAGLALPTVLGAHAGWIAISLGLGALVGTGLGVQLRRRYGRLREITRRLETTSTLGATLVEVTRRFTQIRHTIAAFDQDELDRSSSELVKSTALDLGRSPEEVLRNIHQAMWDLAADESEDSAAAVLHVIDEMGRRVDAAEDDAGRLRSAARVMDFDEPVEPVDSTPPMRATVAGLAQALQDMDRAAEGRRQALDQIRRLNGHESQDG